MKNVKRARLSIVSDGMALRNVRWTRGRKGQSEDEVISPVRYQQSCRVFQGPGYQSWGKDTNDQSFWIVSSELEFPQESKACIEPYTC